MTRRPSIYGLVLGLAVLPPCSLHAGNDRYGVMGVPGDRRAVDAVQALGVGWVRVTTFLGERPRDLRTLPQIPRKGLRLWLTLTHRDRENCVEKGTVGFARSPRGGFAPRDPARYQEVVRKTVRPIVDSIRAEGKVPGAWLVVQIENEVLPTDLRPPDASQRFWHGTADDYLRTLSIAYEAVKSVEPTVPVAAFGFSSEMLAEFVAARRPQIPAWGERVLREGRFDLIDVHLYDAIDEIPAKVAWVRARTDRPIHATEVGGPDPNAGGDPTVDAELTADLFRRMRVAREAGVGRAFWVLLYPTGGAEGRFRGMSLLDAKGRRRPAFEVYRKLIREQ